MTRAYYFVSLEVKMIFLGSALVLSLPVEAKTQYFVHFSFNFTLQLIRGNSKNPQNYLGTLVLQRLLGQVSE